MELCFGQRIDPQLGILEPWYVNACVDRIKEMDLSDKSVMEWGSGASTLWWARRAMEVYSVDHNAEWAAKTANELIDSGLSHKGAVQLVQTHEGDQSEMRDKYVEQFPFPHIFDICIVDGIHRYECAEYAVMFLKPRILIIDNHQQDYVFMCPSLDVLLDGVKMERFVQPDHTNHEGNPWATAIFYL